MTKSAAQFLGFSAFRNKITDSLAQVAVEAITAYKRRTGSDPVRLYIHPATPKSQLESIGLPITFTALVQPGQVLAGKESFDEQPIATNPFTA
jgi:hypothetical protein